MHNVTRPRPETQTHHMHEHQHVDEPKFGGAGDLRTRAVLVCVSITAIVSLAEIVIGWRFNLLSVFGEGLHTGADLIDSLTAFFLVRAAARPADSKHPYGHGKFDALASLIEGLAVGGSAMWILYQSSLVLLGLAEVEPQPGIAAIAIISVAAVGYFIASRYVLRIAELTNSPTVRAEGLHLGTHIWIAFGLVAGLVLTRLAQSGQWTFADRIDPMIAFVLGLYLFAVSVHIIKPGLAQLMDTALPREELNCIITVIDRFAKEFIEVHGIRTRGAGSEKHIDIHLMVRTECTVGEAHDLCHRIERAIMKEIPSVKLLVHVEPAPATAIEAYLLRDSKGLLILDRDSPNSGEDSHHAHGDAHH